MAGFGSMNPKDAMGKSDKLKDMFGSYWFDWKNATKSQYFRPIGPVIAYEYVWFSIITKHGKQINVPRLCIDLDPYTDTYTSDVCPFRNAMANGQADSVGRMYIVNGIWRKAQDEEPKKVPAHTDFEKKLRKVIAKTPDYPQGWEAYQMAPNSESWMPVYVFNLTANNASKVADLSSENMVKGVAYDATDEDHGFDIKAKHDPNGTGSGKYQFDFGESSPMEDFEMDYLVHKLDVLKFPSPKEADNDFKELKGSLDTGEKPVKEDKQRGRASASRLDDDEPESSSRSERGSSRRGKEEDDDEPAPSRTASRPVRGAAKSAARGSSRRDLDDDIPF